MTTRVLVAGAGAVGRALAASLERAGLAVSRWSRRGGLTPAVERSERAAPRFEVVLLAVSDAAIGDVAARLLDEHVAGADAVFLHTAGGVSPAEAFVGVRGRVVGIGLLHPLRAFAGATADVDLRGTVFGVAGDDAGREAARSLAARLGGHVLQLDDGGLRRYHAAAVLVANHALALVDAAVGLLEGEGLARRAAETALASLLASAATNVGALGSPAALTGPMSRGDAVAIARHLAALPPSVATLYRQTGAALLDVARRQGRATPDAYDRVAQALRIPSSIEETAGASRTDEASED